LSAEKVVERDKNGRAADALPDRFTAVTLAADIRTSLLFHQQLGIERYPLKRASRSVMPSPQKSPFTDTVAIADQLARLHQDIQACRLCTLAATRQGQVAGAGTVASRLLIIGDSSRQKAEFTANTLFGDTEDAMLWNMMRAIGLAPEDVYVTNTIKCCPPTLHQPEKESEQRCLAYLHREIELVQPQVICAMGETAVRAILGSKEPVARLRGKFHHYRYGGEAGSCIPVMVTFHPRSLLECTELKKATWHDLQMIQRQLKTFCDNKGGLPGTK
jgi:uracil-DNA glycosylase